MPIHDWTRVSAGTFHDFHTAWITHLKEALNEGLLPDGYYAMSEQHLGANVADVLTLQTPSLTPNRNGGGLAVAEVPPQVERRTVSRQQRRTIAIRHVSGHRVVALIEIASRANKDRASSVRDFVDKATGALNHGVNLLLADLFPPGPHDPEGLVGAIWDEISRDDYESPSQKPLALAALVAGPVIDAYIDNRAVGEPLPEMPLFLSGERYVNVPLESTYNAAFAGMPAIWRNALEVAP